VHTVSIQPVRILRSPTPVYGIAWLEIRHTPNFALRNKMACYANIAELLRVQR
jgi:hypothetical protein